MTSGVCLTYQERVLSFCPVLLYGFAEILTAKAIVVFGAYRERINRQSEYQSRLQPEGMCLSSDVYNQFVHSNVRVERQVFRSRRDDRHHQTIGCIRLSPRPINPLGPERSGC